MPMKRLITFTLAVFLTISLFAQYDLNMPGEWNAWANPPDTACFANYLEGGFLSIDSAVFHWHYQTVFYTSDTTKLKPGVYQFKFTAPDNSGNYWEYQWTVAEGIKPGIIYSLTYCSSCNPANDTVYLTDTAWYVMNFNYVGSDPAGYSNTSAIFMELSDTPSVITHVYYDSIVSSGTAPTVSILLNKAPCPEEKIYVRYTTDNWTTISMEPMTFSDTKPDSAYATLPTLNAGDSLYLYVFTTAYPSISSVDPSDSYTIDLITIRHANNHGKNYLIRATAATLVKNVKQLRFSLYPNPAHNRISVVLPYNAQIQILTVDGKILLKQNAPRSGKYDLDISKLQPGIYLLRIQNSKAQYTREFIKY